MNLNGYKPVIGLEIHVQLATKSKMFSSAPNNPDEKQPNTNIDEVVTAEPGTLPVLNKEAVRLGVMVGLALNCEIPEYSKFDRKHYFYPDLPKGYQISQYDEPIALNGWVEILVPTNGERDAYTKRIRITRAHLEEDAGKNMHPEGLPYSLVDYNRAGSPLLEIVTEPDIETAEEARIFLQELQRIVRYVGASSADMEKGTMRCEPNISVRKPGEESLPKYKVEVKNINSFKFAEAAINYEIPRHIEMLEAGGMPKQVTMGWNEKTNKTVEQRSKEEANDYRYFPEPDLAPMRFTKEFLDELRGDLPELPSQKRVRFKQEFALDESVIETLLNWKDLNEYFEDVVSEIDAWIITDSSVILSDSEESQSSDPSASPQDDGKEISQDDGKRARLIKAAANWCIQEFSALLNADLANPSDSKVSAENMAELVKLIDAGKISGSAAKQVFKKMYETGGEPDHIVEELGLSQVSDEGAIETAVDEIIAANPKAVEDYKAGQQKSFGFLVGQVMAAMKGKANPQVVNEILKEKLS
ncbi:TPA: Asp-tRNA(Asn)/Glu-tRNA(Gln) amidotransferase GatCAB subunit B [Patescibacteria group bacterium]|jgi:aspartyl-tRNA(Asn)/glutamyl-tRNA(Gln) amidotransferase subunit B|nr:Asp-tRNA(Asn)/Glu-tRNA(Gln) amidotransferase GatCAB subunit B [Patescibacteria group bacterium]